MIHCYQTHAKQELNAMHQSQQSAPSYSPQVYGNLNLNFNQQAQQQSDQSHQSNRVQCSPVSGDCEQQHAALFSQQQQQLQQGRQPAHESSQTNSNPLGCDAPSAADDNNRMTKPANQISPIEGDGQQRPTLIDTTRHHLSIPGGPQDSPGEFKHTHQQQEHSTTELYDRLYGGRLVEDEHLEASLQEDWTSHLHGFDFGSLHQQVPHDQYASPREHTAGHDDDQQQQQQAYRQQSNYNNQQVAIDDRKPAHDFNNNNNNNNNSNEHDTTNSLSFAPLMPIVDTNQQQDQREQQPTSNNYYQTYQQQSSSGDPYLQSQMSPPTSTGKQQTFAAHDNHQVAPRYHYTPTAAPLQQQHHNYDESQQRETSFQDYYTYANFEPTSGDQQQQQQHQTQEYHTFDLPYESQQPHFRLTECSPTETSASYSVQQPMTKLLQNQQSFSDHNHLNLVSPSSSSSSSSSPSASSQSSVTSSPASSGASSTSSAENRPAIICTPAQNEEGGTMKTLMKSLATSVGGGSSTKLTGNTGGSARNRRGRPRKKGANAKGKVSGKLWEFIRDLLLSERTNPSFIRWERREDGVFKFVQSDKVAKMWGERKQNPKMTYEKLSRAMRYYYKSKVLLPVFGRRLVYKFGPNATGWMPVLASAVSVAQAPPPQSGSCEPSPVAPSTMTLVYHHHHPHESTRTTTSASGQPHTIHYGSAEHVQQHQNNHHRHQHGQQQPMTTAPTTATTILRHHEEIIY